MNIIKKRSAAQIFLESIYKINEGDTGVEEPVVPDEIDIITLDVPALIRLLEVSREEINSDSELHQLVAKVIAAAKSGTITTEELVKLLPENKKPI